LPFAILVNHKCGGAQAVRSEVVIKQPQTNEGTMLKVFKGISEFYANGTVYITDGERVQKFEKHNYQIQNLKNHGDDLWITTGVVVALGACCGMPEAIKQLKEIIRKMKSEVRMLESKLDS
jgi:hypothetical protein